MAVPDLNTIHARKNALAKAGLHLDTSYEHFSPKKPPSFPTIHEPALYERAESLARAGIIGEFAFRNRLTSFSTSFTSLPLLFIAEPLELKQLNDSFSSSDFESETLASIDNNTENTHDHLNILDEYDPGTFHDLNNDVFHLPLITKTQQTVYCLDSDTLLVMVFVSLCSGLSLKGNTPGFKTYFFLSPHVNWPTLIVSAIGSGLSFGILAMALGLLREFWHSSHLTKRRWRLLFMSSILATFSVTLGIVAVLGIYDTLIEQVSLAACLP